MTTLKPGILVSLKTTIRGGVVYERVDTLPETSDGESSTAKWETTRRIEDVEEHKLATQKRAEAGTRIRRCCISTSFGLLCPDANAEALRIGMAEAQEIVAQFNAKATTTKIGVFTITGRIAKNDADAARAIAAELAELLGAMNQGLLTGDVDMIRKAAADAKRIGDMLEGSQAEQISAAVKAARESAREIVRRVEKKGEKFADVARELNTKPVQVARFAFIDLSEQEAATRAEDALPAVNVQRFGAIADEQDDDAEQAAEPVAVARREIEVG